MIAGPRIAVLILTRGRPGGLVAAVTALQATASGRLPVEFVLCCDDDDPSIAAALPLLEAMPVVISRNPRPDALGRAWNLGARAAGAWDLALLTGDDTVPVTQWWDLQMADTAAAGHPAWAWEEANDPENCTYPVLTRAWFDALGGRLVPECFPFWFNDTWIAETTLFLTGRPIRIDPHCRMGGRRGTTREMREVAFWFRFFAATRGIRLGEARQIADATGRVLPDPGPLLAWCAEWDRAQAARVPVYNEAFGADRLPPTPRYARLRDRAARWMAPPAALLAEGAAPPRFVDGRLERRP